MILRTMTILLTLNCSFISPLFAGTERGDHLVTEGGGLQGIAGVAGPLGAPGLAGAAGAAGIEGGAGISGIPGIPGAPGILGFADFYALQGGAFTDNPVIPAGSAVNFPRNGSIGGTITRISTSSFNLPTIGTYLVLFQVDVTGNGQLMLRLNSGLVLDSVAGRATGSSQISGLSLVTTTAANSVLEVVNPPGNIAIAIPANDGGTQPISAHIIIIRVQ